MLLIKAKSYNCCMFVLSSLYVHLFPNEIGGNPLSVKEKVTLVIIL
jgi:hypothetical protein